MNLTKFLYTDVDNQLEILKWSGLKNGVELENLGWQFVVLK